MQQENDCGFGSVLQPPSLPESIVGSQRKLEASSYRVSYRGGGGLEFPPPEILKLSMITIVLSQVLNSSLVPDCVRSNLRGFKFKKFSWGEGMPPVPLVGMYT